MIKKNENKKEKAKVKEKNNSKKKKEYLRQWSVSEFNKNAKMRVTWYHPEAISMLFSVMVKTSLNTFHWSIESLQVKVKPSNGANAKSGVFEKIKQNKISQGAVPCTVRKLNRFKRR